MFIIQATGVDASKHAFNANAMKLSMTFGIMHDIQHTL